MKLRNKQTGEIWNLINRNEGTSAVIWVSNGCQTYRIGTIKELAEEWEDYEEPKEHWCITMYGGITRIKDNEEPIDNLIEIGNYFNSKEDAYDAWDKLKAWKRLKDKGFEITLKGYGGSAWLEANWGNLQGDYSDVLILFGGEE